MLLLFAMAWIEILAMVAALTRETWVGARNWER